MSTPPTAIVTHFEQLVEQHSREIFRYLWRLTGNAADAEDCLQDTFLRAYKAFARLKNHDNLRAWLYKIATNTAHSHLKRQARHARHTSETPLDKLLGSASPAALVERKLELADVQAAVDALPAKQRAALLMYRYQHMSYAEISAALNIKESAARANVYQATKKLKAQFADQLKE